MQPAAVLNILVNANTRKAQTELRRLDRQVGDTARTAQRASGRVDLVNAAFTRMGRSSNNASRGLRRLIPDLNLTTRIPVYKIAAIGTAIAAIIPPTVALAGALGPLLGNLAAIPALASAAAQGIGALVLGFVGVGDAVKAAFDAQKTAAKDTGTAMKAAQGNAERVREATQGVASARRDLADASRTVGDAESNLAESQRQSRMAQDDLNAARRDAARDLIDMRLAVAGAALSEKEARLQLRQAIEEQTRVMADESSTATDIQQAQLGIQQARLGVKQATVDANRAQKDYNEAQRKGVAGSDQVVAAQEAIRSAQQGVIDAQRGLSDAHRGVADAQRALVEATKEVKLAQRDQATSAGEATAGINKLQEAMANLPPAAQAFVRFIVGLKPQMDALRDAAASGLFPGLTRGIESAMRNFGVFRQIIASTALSLGELAAQAGQQIGSAEWGKDLEVQGQRNVVVIERLGTAGLHLADAFRHVTLAAGPLVGWLTQQTVRFSRMIELWAQTGRESGKLEAFFQKTIRTTKVVVTALVDFGMALYNIGRIATRVWGVDLLKNIGEAAKSLRNWTESVRGSRDIEQYFVRWRKRWGDIVHWIGRVIEQYRELRRQGQSVTEAFVKVFSGAISEAIAVALREAAQAAPKLAIAFVQGFLNAGIWGQALMVGWFARKFIFRAAISKAGVAAALLFGKSFVGSIGASAGAGVGAGAGGALLGGLLGAFKSGKAAGGIAGALRGVFGTLAKSGVGRLAGVGIGVAAGAAIVNGMKQQIDQKGLRTLKESFGELGAQAKGGGLGGQIIEFFGGKSDTSKRAQALADALKNIADNQKQISFDRAKGLREEIAKMPGLSDRAREAFNRMLDRSLATAEGFQKVRRRIRELREGGSENIEFLKNKVNFNMKLIRESLGTHSRRGKEALANNFMAAVKNIRQSMEAGTISTKKGLRLIEEYMVKALKLMGFNRKDALALARKDPSSKLSPGPGGKGQLRPNQRGGPIDEGKPVGDSVPVLAERGEYVLNRKAVSKVGRKTLDAINFGVAPRFQRGGGIQMPSGGFPDAMGALPGLDALAYVMKQKFGLSVTSGLRPGSITPSGSISNHSWGGAIDISNGVTTPQMDQAANWLAQMGGFSWSPQWLSGGPIRELGYKVRDHYDHIHVSLHRSFANNAARVIRWLRQGGGALGLAGMMGMEAPKIKGVEVEGPESALKSVVQGTLDTARAGAQQVVNRLAGSASGAGAMAGISGSNQQMARKMMGRFGFGADQWGALKELWTRESGWDEGARNPDSGAYGIPQSLPASKMGPAAQGTGMDAARHQIHWGLKYIKGRYGSPSAALAFHDSHNWYQQGGSVAERLDHPISDETFAKRGTQARNNPLWGMIKKTLKIVRGSDKKKVRDKALRGLDERIKGIDVPGMEKIQELQTATAMYGEFADRALALSTEIDTTAMQGWPAELLRPVAFDHWSQMSPRQQGLINFSGRSLEGLDADTLMAFLETPRWGQTGGKTQIEWLETQLETLRVLRNALIDAENAIIQKRERVKQLIAQAEQRLKEVIKEIEEAARTRRRLANALEKIEELSGKSAPEKARKIVDNLRGDIPGHMWKALHAAVSEKEQPVKKVKAVFKDQIERVDDNQKPRVRVRNALETQIIPGLIERRNELTRQLDEEITPSLSEVQGQVLDEALRKQVFSQLPELGVLGGQIFDVQMSLRELGIPRTLPVPQPEVAEAAEETESAELLRQLLREANLRTATSEAAFKVFQNMPQYGRTGVPFGGEFAEGGVVPGPMGSPRVILAHGGEIVTPPGQMGEIQVNVFVEPGHDYLKDKIRVEVEQMSRAVSRAAARGLPSRGGGV